MTFKAIETQEELDRIIQDRLTREKEKFSDYEGIKTRNTELETEVGTLRAQTTESSKTHEQTLAELNTKIAGYETANLRTKIAIANGIPLEYADRLVGTDEESFKTDAERMAPMFKVAPTIAPLKTTEPNLGDEKSGAYKNLLKGLKSEGE